MVPKVIVDHWSDIVEPLILEQYKESTRWKACLKSVIDEMQRCGEAKAWELSRILDIRDFSKVTSGKLDFVGSLLNVERMTGESNDDYYSRLINATTARNAGTPEGIIYESRMLSGDASPVYLDEAPATFMVYTPNGIQLKRETVQKMAPAGVLGLPAAALKLGNGCFLAMTSGETMLTAAIDDIDSRWRGYCNDHEITMSNGGDECRISDGGDGYIYARETLFDCDSVSEE